MNKVVSLLEWFIIINSKPHHERNVGNNCFFLRRIKDLRFQIFWESSCKRRINLSQMFLNDGTSVAVCSFTLICVIICLMCFSFTVFWTSWWQRLDLAAILSPVPNRNRSHSKRKKGTNDNLPLVAVRVLMYRISDDLSTGHSNRQQLSLTPFIIYWLTIYEK